MAKKVFYDEDARKRVLGGAEILYNAVKTTMGPKGRNVVISKTADMTAVNTAGMVVTTTIDPFHQDAALAALVQGLARVESLPGYRHPRYVPGAATRGVSTLRAGGGRVPERGDAWAGWSSPRPGAPEDGADAGGGVAFGAAGRGGA